MIRFPAKNFEFLNQYLALHAHSGDVMSTNVNITELRQQKYDEIFGDREFKSEAQRSLKLKLDQNYIVSHNVVL